MLVDVDIDELSGYKPSDKGVVFANVFVYALIAGFSLWFCYLAILVAGDSSQNAQLGLRRLWGLVLRAGLFVCVELVNLGVSLKNCHPFRLKTASSLKMVRRWHQLKMLKRSLLKLKQSQKKPKRQGLCHDIGV